MGPKLLSLLILQNVKLVFAKMVLVEWLLSFLEGLDWNPYTRLLFSHVGYALATWQ